MSAITVTESLTTLVCCSCGVCFAMPECLQRNYSESGEQFYCPNGHPQSYGKGTNRILREQLDQKQRELTAAKSETLAEKIKREQAEKELTRHKRRTKNGVCPCCNRSFLNLQRHLATKHPEFKP